MYGIVRFSNCSRAVESAMRRDLANLRHFLVLGVAHVGEGQTFDRDCTAAPTKREYKTTVD